MRSVPTQSSCSNAEQTSPAGINECQHCHANKQFSPGFNSKENWLVLAVLCFHYACPTVGVDFGPNVAQSFCAVLAQNPAGAEPEGLTFWKTPRQGGACKTLFLSRFPTVQSSKSGFAGFWANGLKWDQFA